MRDNIVYEVRTDYDPETLTEVGIQVYQAWVSFALGKSTIGGERIEFPTGRYASSIKFVQRGRSKVSIIADSAIAPEALYIEVGHGEIDLKKFAGKRVALHRGRPGDFGSIGYGKPIFSTKPKGRLAQSGFAAAKGRGMTGYRTIGTEPGTWVIPAMRAYSPAQHLRDLIEQDARRGVVNWVDL